MKERRVAVVGSVLFAAHSNRRAAHFRRVVYWVSTKEAGKKVEHTGYVDEGL